MGTVSAVMLSFALMIGLIILGLFKLRVGPNKDREDDN